MNECAASEEGADSYQFRLGHSNVAIGRAWRIQCLSQPKHNIPCESGILWQWA